MRTVISKRNRGLVLMNGSGSVREDLPDDTYRERLVKYIPAETLALFIAVYGVGYYISGSEDWFPVMARWILVAGLFGTVLFLWRVEGVTDIVQIAISAIGFLVWVSALAIVPVASLPYYNAGAAAVFLPIWIFLSPFLDGIPERW